MIDLDPSNHNPHPGPPDLKIHYQRAREDLSSLEAYAPADNDDSQGAQLMRDVILEQRQHLHLLAQSLAGEILQRIGQHVIPMPPLITVSLN